jgi:hypothetical protein
MELQPHNNIITIIVGILLIV